MGITPVDWGVPRGGLISKQKPVISKQKPVISEQKPVMKKTIAFCLRMSDNFVLTRTSLENSREKKGFARFSHSNFSRDVLFRTQHHLHALPKTTELET